MPDTWCKRANYELILRSFNNDVEAALCCKSQNPVSLFDDGAIQKVKDDLNNGIKNSHCHICWLHESKGISSWRLQGNVTRIEEKSVEIYLDNTCDQSCIYCSPKYSSQWAQEINYANSKDKKLLKNLLNDETFIPTEKKNHTRAILDHLVNVGKESKPYESFQFVLLGGEPLLSPYIKHNIIDDIVNAFYTEANVNTPLKIMIVTNGNTPDALIDKTIKTIDENTKKYPKLKFAINLSMESTETVSEFVRYGVNWNQFIKNYKKYLENSFEVGFSMTLNSVSFLDTPNFLTEMIEIAKNTPGWRKRTFFRINVAQYPKFLSIAMLPETQRYIFDECKTIIKKNKQYILDDFFYNQVLKEIYFAEKLFGTESNKKLQIKLANRYFNYLEKTRKLCLKDINIDLYNYIKNTSQ